MGTSMRRREFITYSAARLQLGQLPRRPQQPERLVGEIGHFAL
jgi:hypothetical protein